MPRVDTIWSITGSVFLALSFFFRLKLLNNPGAYTRCDAAVLYIRQRDYAAISLAVGPLYASFAAVLFLLLTPSAGPPMRLSRPVAFYGILLSVSESFDRFLSSI